MSGILLSRIILSVLGSGERGSSIIGIQGSNSIIGTQGVLSWVDSVCTVVGSVLCSASIVGDCCSCFPGPLRSSFALPQLVKHVR